MDHIERGDQGHSENVDFIFRAQNSYGTYEKKNRLELYKAALSNDWKKAETIYKNTKMGYGVRITKRGETALHIAALAGHTEFVQNLVRKMSSEEIRIETKLAKSNETGKGNTAFHCAVISGNVKIAKAIMECEDLHGLAMAKGVGNHLPIYVAAKKGNGQMVRYLYDLTYKIHLKHLECRDNGDEDEDRRRLFLSLIKSNIHDVALKMAKELFPRRIAPKEMEEEALEEIAKIPLNPPQFLQRCIHSILGRQGDAVMQENTVELVRLLWDSLTLNGQRASSFINSPDPNPVMEAAKCGNFNFLSILIATYPDILFAYDHNKFTIIHHATLNRHIDIFKFIHIGSAKPLVTMYGDSEGNNILHLAAKLAPANRLDIVPGAALQLQRELLWFEDMNEVMEQYEQNQNDKSTEEYTPHDIFVKEHENLMEKGEKWMRDTANSCMIVAVLITTIAFAAAITVPGDYGDDGHPHLWKKAIFRAFALADSISMISSATSLLNFLSILTARYTIDDFRRSLPNKLFVGLSTIFISIVAMMVAFVLSIFIIFKRSKPPLFSILIAAASSVPIIMFLWQHSGLFVDVFRSTYASYFLFKPRNDPSSVFKRTSSSSIELKKAT